ncbi:hypothetical protein FH972_022396 [Carpinus fangiana]|uniref:Uncharacterized protein n=1 Tax=Carpinus fangiana TaxID=176857 RepID=A0A5N6KS53_9ROSI|nr:hypothetical protein FH972_022396 [Carpinus fangiana]
MSSSRELNSPTGEPSFVTRRTWSRYRPAADYRPSTPPNSPPMDRFVAAPIGTKNIHRTLSSSSKRKAIEDKLQISKQNSASSLSVTNESVGEQSHAIIDTQPATLDSNFAWDSRWMISVPSNEGMQRDVLVSVARTFLELESILINAFLDYEIPPGTHRICPVFEQDLRIQDQMRQRTRVTYEIGLNEYKERINKWLEDYEKIRLNICEIHQDYLSNRDSVSWFGMADLWFKERLDLLNSSLAVMEEDEETNLSYQLNQVILDVKERAQYLPQGLADLQFAGLFDSEVWIVTRKKMKYLDAIFDSFERSNETFDRELMTWSKIVKRLQSIQPALGRGTKVEAPESKLVLNSANAAIPSIMMWATFVATVVCSLPTFALGWQHSTHGHGTTQDSDFWFLVQSSIMQFLGTLTVAIPTHLDTNLFGTARWFTWIALCLTSMCSIVAPVLYLHLPTEWSQLVSIMGGSIQAFVTLQLALAVGERPKALEHEKTA